MFVFCFIYSAQCFTLLSLCAIMIMLLPASVQLKIIERSELSLMTSIGSKLKTLRKGRKLTQLELSERLELSRATISNYEVGRRTPHLSELRRFAEFYGVGLDYFGVDATDESFELLSRAKSVFTNKDIPVEERERLYKEIMKMYLEM